jgi:hypothetical protein
MPRHRFFTAAVVAAVFACVTGAFAYYKLAGAGETMLEEANKFLGTFSGQQKDKVKISYDEKTRTDWHFIPKPDGVRKAALSLLKGALSEAGYGKATKIMSLEGLLHELEKAKGGKNVRDTERYFFTIYGTPTPESKWGLSVEGHHLSLNFVVDKGHVVSTTPSAFGANPAIVKNDNLPNIPKGTRVLAKEETLALELLKSLTPEQRKEATLEELPKEVHNAGEAQPTTDLPKGLSAEKLAGEQKSQLRTLVEEYANSFPPDVAKERMEAIRSGGVEKISFAWAGSEKEGEGRYYCIQGPTFQIEFINVQADSAGNPANHIHSVWRDVRGDFNLPLK